MRLRAGLDTRCSVPSRSPSSRVCICSSGSAPHRDSSAVSYPRRRNHLTPYQTTSGNAMSMLPITHLTIHCAATPEGRDVKPETIEQWDIAKFGQKSYHWIVTLDGTKHRSLRDDQKGAHVGGHNTGNIGVCYVGGMDKDMHAPKDTRTAAQKASLLTLVRTYQERYPGIVIRGHRDWPGVQKACPSFSVAEWLADEGVGA